MVKLSELLKWKKKVEFDIPGSKEKKVVWVRVVGDHDLEEATSQARIVSRAWRDKLRNPETDEYKEFVLVLDEYTNEQLQDVIRSGQGSNWLAEAFSIVERPNQVEIKEIAIDPDAPTLEEMEKMDEENERLNKEYRKAIAEYVDTKGNELIAKVSKMDRIELLHMARENTAIILPYIRFLEEAQKQKVFRSTFSDEKCKVREFDTYEEYLQTDVSIRDRLEKEYNALEPPDDEVKN